MLVMLVLASFQSTFLSLNPGFLPQNNPVSLSKSGFLFLKPSFLRSKNLLACFVLLRYKFQTLEPSLFSPSQNKQYAEREGGSDGYTGNVGGRGGRWIWVRQRYEVSGCEEEAMGEVCGRDKRPVEEDKGLVGDVRLAGGGGKGVRRGCEDSPGAQGKNKLSGGVGGGGGGAGVRSEP